MAILRLSRPSKICSEGGRWIRTATHREGDSLYWAFGVIYDLISQEASIQDKMPYSSIFQICVYYHEAAFSE